MKKVYNLESKPCPICKKKVRSFVEYNNELMCQNCFLNKATSKFIKEHPESLNIKKKRYKHSKTLGGKEIYAINGITAVCRGGCFN